MGKLTKTATGTLGPTMTALLDECGWLRRASAFSTFCFAKRWSQKATTIQAAARLAQARSTGPRGGCGRADRGHLPHVLPAS